MMSTDCCAVESRREGMVVLWGRGTGRKVSLCDVPSLDRGCCACGSHLSCQGPVFALVTPALVLVDAERQGCAWRDARGGVRARTSSGRMHCPLVACPLPLHVLSILLVPEGPSVQGRCLRGSWAEVVGRRDATLRPQKKRRPPCGLKKRRHRLGHHDRGPRDKGRYG